MLRQFQSAVLTLSLLFVFPGCSQESEISSSDDREKQSGDSPDKAQVETKRTALPGATSESYQARQRRLNNKDYSSAIASLSSPTEHDAAEVAEIRALSDPELSNAFQTRKQSERWHIFLELLVRDRLRLGMTKEEVEGVLGKPLRSPQRYQAMGTKEQAYYGVLNPVSELWLYYDKGVVVGICSFFEGEAAGPGIEIWHDGKQDAW